MSGPVSPPVTGGRQPEEQARARAGGSSGALDSQRMRHRAQLVRIACDIAAVAKRYQKIHQALFGFSVRRVLRALQPNKLTDFAALEIELNSIEAESKRVQRAIDHAGLDDLPKRAKTIVAIRDALKEYARAVSDGTLKLNLMCRSLRRESEGEMGFTDYSASQFRLDKTAYDGSIQEFRRWGTRLTELFGKF